MILATRFTFIVEKTCTFTLHTCTFTNMACPPQTYDAISRNHRNWQSLNLTQNAHERWTKSYRKHQMLMFNPLGENSEKLEGGAPTLSPPPPLYVRGLKNSLKGHISLMALGEIRSQSLALFVLILIIASVTSKEFFFPYGQKRFRSISERSGLTFAF